jgi:SAM-dependent methyltransferase
MSVTLSQYLYALRSRIALRTRVRNLLAPPLAALPNHENILSNPFISAKLIPDTSRDCKIVLQNSHNGPDTPIPPVSLWEGYDVDGGVEHYLLGGQKTMRTMLDILHAAGAQRDSMRKVLELGCASGRVLRHFPIVKGIELWGVDIKAKHVAWCQENFPDPFRFYLGTTYPHLPFEDNSYDLAYCHSVFTHISDLADSWILELLRVIRHGGYLFVTIHDKNSIKYLLESERSDLKFLTDMLRNADRQTNLLSSNFGHFSLGTDPTTQVFYDQCYLVRKWSSFARVISLTENAEDYQSSIVLQKR